VPDWRALSIVAPPDPRRCLPVRVADVPLEQRVEAVREFSHDFVDDPAERLALFDLAVSPRPDLIAWVAPPRPTFTNGTRKRNAVTREEVERIFELREQGLSYRVIGERLDRPISTVKAIGGMGREEALRRLDARADRELERLIRSALEQRLAAWAPR
jgi:hypothetical protein